MRSNELADLAGVTVRTLRHYHQIGLLEEPERSANGYRRYTVRHLATVLRIVSFTNLGVPLAEVREVIDDTAAASDLLDRIDRQAAAEIDRLTGRRAAISRLRDGGAQPDLPEALIPYASLFRPRAGAAPAVQAHEREQLALIGHVGGGAGLPWLAAAYENLAGERERYEAIMTEFDALSDEAPAEQRQRLVEEILDLLTTAVPLDDAPRLDADSAALLLTHQDDHHNAAQRSVWDDVLRRLNATDA